MDLFAPDRHLLDEREKCSDRRLGFIDQCEPAAEGSDGRENTWQGRADAVAVAVIRFMASTPLSACPSTRLLEVS